MSVSPESGQADESQEKPIPAEPSRTVEDISHMLWTQQPAAGPTEGHATGKADLGDLVTCYICGEQVTMKTKRDWQFVSLVSNFEGTC